MNQKLEKIYSVMADKTLSFWCIVQWYKTYGRLACDTRFVEDCEEWVFVHNDWELGGAVKGTSDFSIIGHPVMYWNTVKYIEETQDNDIEYFNVVLYHLRTKWKDKTKPIDNQPQETIDFVESLIK